MEINPLLGALCLILVMILASSSVLVVCDPLDERVSALLSDLEYLNSMGVDVENLTKSLNTAIKLYESNRSSEALLENLSAEIQVLKSRAEEIHFRIMLSRYLGMASVLSLPVVAYLAIPRIYLYVWYRLHRSWIARRVKRSDAG